MTQGTLPGASRYCVVDFHHLLIAVFPRRTICPRLFRKNKGRSKFQSVAANYYDTDTGPPGLVSTGNGKPQYLLRPVFNNKAEAERHCKAKSMELNREQYQVSVDLPGRLDVIAEGVVELANYYREEINGKWSVKSIQLSFGNEQFKLSLELVVKSN